MEAMNLHNLQEELRSTGNVCEFLDGFGEVRHDAERYKPARGLFGETAEMSIARDRYEAAMEMRELARTIPSIQFPAHWHVTIIPPFCGASVRFLVSLEAMPQEERAGARTPASVSVYLDCFAHLGAMRDYSQEGAPPIPYWEVYPVGDNTERFLMAETAELVACIEASLVALRETPQS